MLQIDFTIELTHFQPLDNGQIHTPKRLQTVQNSCQEQKEVKTTGDVVDYYPVAHKKVDLVFRLVELLHLRSILKVSAQKSLIRPPASHTPQ